MNDFYVDHNNRIFEIIYQNFPNRLKLLTTTPSSFPIPAIHQLNRAGNNSICTAPYQNKRQTQHSTGKLHKITVISYKYTLFLQTHTRTPKTMNN